MQQRLVSEEQERNRAAHARASAELGSHDEAGLSAGETLSRYQAEQMGDQLHFEAQARTVAARRRVQIRSLMIQPPLYWSVLLLVAAATGLLSTANPSLRQPILLHVVPQVLAFLAGYRMKDPKLGALSGALFHVARAVMILVLAAGPHFMSVARDYPAQLTWLFFLPIALGALGGWIGRSQKRASPAPRGAGAAGAAGAAAVIALTCWGIAPRFLNSAPGGPLMADLPAIGAPADLNMPVTPIAPAAPVAFAESGSVRIGDLGYGYDVAVNSVPEDALAGMATSDAPLMPGSGYTSPDGSTKLELDKDGNLIWNKAGQAPRQIASADNGAISQTSSTDDGMMTVFKQGDNFMVSTPSKGTRPLEDLLRQFGKDAAADAADGTVEAASIQGNTVTALFRNAAGELLRFTMNINP